MTRPHCETCVFFQLLIPASASSIYYSNGDVATPLALGECRARPPRSGYYDEGWPRVTHRDWCGGYRSAKGEVL